MTSNQIFKINVDINLLFNLLDLICKKTPNYYIFNFDSYKTFTFIFSIFKTISTNSSFERFFSIKNSLSNNLHISLNCYGDI